MQGYSILFADDDVLTQWTMTEVLAEAGFDVTSACRGAEAFSLLGDMPELDLLITDVDLPDNVSGIDVGHVWRRQRPGRPVIYIGTSRHPATRRLEAHETFLCKPFTPATLLSTIATALEEAVLHPAVPAPIRPTCHVH